MVGVLEFDHDIVDVIPVDFGVFADCRVDEDGVGRREWVARERLVGFGVGVEAGARRYFFVLDVEDRLFAVGRFVAQDRDDVGDVGLARGERRLAVVEDGERRVDDGAVFGEVIADEFDANRFDFAVARGG